MRDCKEAGKGTYLHIGDGFTPPVPAGIPALSMHAEKQALPLKDCKLLGAYRHYTSHFWGKTESVCICCPRLVSRQERRL